MEKYALKMNSLFKKLTALGAALAMTLGVLVPAQATGGIDVAGQAGSFQSSFVNIQTAVRASNVITFTAIDVHHYRTGDLINAVGLSPSNFEVLNAVVTVTGPFTFTVASAGADGSAAVTGDSLVVKTLKRFVITNIVGDGTSVTVTTSQPHGFTAGAAFVIDDVVRNGGTSLNVDGVVSTSPTANSFTFDSANLATYVSGGAVVANLMGIDFEVNEFIDFRAVFVSGGTPIHATVKMVGQAGLEGTTGTLGQMDNLQNPQASLGHNNFLNSDIDFATGAGDNFAKLEIDFYTGTPGYRTPVTLENLYASVYDIDSSQYVEFSDFSSYFLSSPTDIDVSARGSVTTRFIDGENQSSGDPESYTTNRVTVLFDSVSSFSYTIGKDRTGLTPNSSSAFYQLDLSVGWNVGGAWSAVQAPAVISPLLAKTVIFDSNGGISSMSNQLAGAATALSSNNFTLSDFTFAGWNTAADGSGTSYADGAIYSFTADTTLYAQWTAVAQAGATQPQAPTRYSGPLPERLDISCLAAGVAGTATLTGERLNMITGATVDGKAITLSAISATSVKLALPALAAGTYDVVYSSTNGSITHIASLTVCAASAPAPAEPVVPAPAEPVVTEGATKPFSVVKRFSNYRGDRGPVVATDRAAITKFIMANPGLTHVTCVGSTSGRPAVTTDQALAMARAKNACSVVESLVPGVKTRLVTSTGRGVGQFFRAVTLFGKGEKSN